MLRVLGAVAALGLAGAIGGVLAALIQRAGTKDAAQATRDAAQTARESAVAVAEINREAQRLLALDASRRDWRRHLVQPLLDEMLRRSDLYAQIDEAARAGDGNRVTTLVDQLGPTALETRVLPLLHQVSHEIAEVLGQVTLAETAAWAMAQAAKSGPVGPDFAAQQSLASRLCRGTRAVA